MSKRTACPGHDRDRKYQLAVTSFLTSLLSKNESVRSYRIFSNCTEARPFGDIVAELHFKDQEGCQFYAIQVKVGNGKLDVNKYCNGYRKIINQGGLKLQDKDVKTECINFCYFCNRSPNNDFTFPLKTKTTDIEVKLTSYNRHKSAFGEIDCYRLDSSAPQTKAHTDFLDNVYLFLNLPDTPEIIHRIKDIWHINKPLQLILFLEDYFINTSNALDKETFEHEILKIRLRDYIVTPSRAIPSTHKAVIEWNPLTLDGDVAIVSDEPNVERYLFGCILQNFTHDEINIDAWNSFVSNEGKLDSDIKRRLKPKPFAAETLKDLTLQKWTDNEMPLILKTDSQLPVLKEFSHLNKKYIIIDSNVTERSAEIENYKLRVSKNFGVVADDEIMKSIRVSLQGRQPVSLYEITNGNEALKEAVTYFDVINLTRARTAYVNPKRLVGNDYMLFMIEAVNGQHHNQNEQDGKQPKGSNIVIHCDPNKGCERYREISADSRYKTYKIFHLRSTDDNKLTLISKTDARGITQKCEGRRGLECFFMDENGENIYYMDNGDVIPIIGEVPIRSCWRYVPRYLREVVKKDTPISKDGSTSNKISIEYGKYLLTERQFFSEDNGKMVIVTGEPGMGKTAFLHSLFYSYESKYYVLFVDLDRHQLDLRDDKLKSFEDVLRLSRNRSSCLPYNGLLNRLHDHSNRLVIILDSFDKILAGCEERVLEFIRSLEQIALHKIIIASKLTALNPLINNFEVKLFQLEDSNGRNKLRQRPRQFLPRPVYFNTIAKNPLLPKFKTSRTKLLLPSS